MEGRLSKHDPVWQRICELHTERFSKQRRGVAPLRAAPTNYAGPPLVKSARIASRASSGFEEPTAAAILPYSVRPQSAGGAGGVWSAIRRAD